MVLLTLGFVAVAIVALIIAAIPFWLALKLVGADASIPSVIIASFLGAILQAAVKLFITGTYGMAAGALAAYLAWVLFIQFFFELSFIRAIIASILPGLILAAIIVIGLLSLAL